ncbi:hypothetical protein LTR53_001384 [Teratosphaeriaceae sp. CCFEE 6253]|nr:hypothetical protein LTR53_001384 [Teratosphaeriaceae sp. CCFEE 6253]
MSTLTIVKAKNRPWSWNARESTTTTLSAAPPPPARVWAPPPLANPTTADPENALAIILALQFTHNSPGPSRRQVDVPLAVRKPRRDTPYVGDRCFASTYAFQDAKGRSYRRRALLAAAEAQPSQAVADEPMQPMQTS